MVRRHCLVKVLQFSCSSHVFTCHAGYSVTRETSFRCSATTQIHGLRNLTILQVMCQTLRLFPYRQQWYRGDSPSCRPWQELAAGLGWSSFTNNSSNSSQRIIKTTAVLISWWLSGVHRSRRKRIRIARVVETSPSYRPKMRK